MTGGHPGALPTVVDSGQCPSRRHFRWRGSLGGHLGGGGGPLWDLVLLRDTAAQRVPLPGPPQHTGCQPGAGDAAPCRAAACPERPERPASAWPLWVGVARAQSPEAAPTSNVFSGQPFYPPQPACPGFPKLLQPPPHRLSQLAALGPAAEGAGSLTCSKRPDAAVNSAPQSGPALSSIVANKPSALASVTVVPRGKRF